MRIAQGLPLFVVVVALAAAPAPISSAQRRARAAFMGLAIWSGPLPARPHGELLSIASRLTKVPRIRPLRTAASYARWLNGPYRRMVTDRRAKRARLDELATTLGPSNDDSAFEFVLTAFVVDSDFELQQRADNASPARTIDDAAGIGDDDDARRASVIHAVASRCVQATTAAGRVFAPWTDRCRALETRYRRLTDELCARVTTTRGHMPGTYCGDRPP